MTTEELIALLEKCDREMTPGPWYARWGGEPGHVTGHSGSLLLDTYDETEGDRPNSLGIATLRNNAANIAAALRRLTQERDAALARVKELESSATTVLEWYDRDGSVGGACDPMENLREVLTSNKQSPIGDRDSQAKAWSEVYRTCEDLGLSSFLPSPIFSPGVVRVCQFLRAVDEDRRTFREALREIACFPQGEVVTSSFDNPADAARARRALDAAKLVQ